MTKILDMKSSTNDFINAVSFETIASLILKCDKPANTSRQQPNLAMSSNNESYRTQSYINVRVNESGN